MEFIRKYPLLLAAVILLSACILLALTGCGPNQPPPQPVYYPQAQQAPQPVYQQSQAAPQSNTGELLLAAGAGALAGHLMTKKDAPAAAPAQIINRTVIVKQVVPPAAAPLPAAIMPAATPKPAAVTLSKPAPSFAPPMLPAPPRPSYAPSYRSTPTKVTYRGK